ncbi:hypothetical protein ODU73_002805 [Thermoclostridium stercorarium]|uniref:hypothetical protein n=1 Tax=Thermoclostridium stercorarium TaxID=1510 RepID=UPI0022499BEC|nr:hypothetical protein [Thermoclostridium stercorarium]UZQ85635.1 hypothetical protein ODU73_002805 [Thermoclostridium stercorarium]
MGKIAIYTRVSSEKQAAEEDIRLKCKRRGVRLYLYPKDIKKRILYIFVTQEFQV